jgi:hypothetical protein
LALFSILSFSFLFFSWVSSSFSFPPFELSRTFGIC